MDVVPRRFPAGSKMMPLNGASPSVQFFFEQKLCRTEKLFSESNLNVVPPLKGPPPEVVPYRFPNPSNVTAPVEKPPSVASTKEWRVVRVCADPFQVNNRQNVRTLTRGNREERHRGDRFSDEQRLLLTTRKDSSLDISILRT